MQKNVQRQQDGAKSPLHNLARMDSGFKLLSHVLGNSLGFALSAVFTAATVYIIRHREANKIRNRTAALEHGHDH